jgi:hypothetical protein
LGRHRSDPSLGLVADASDESEMNFESSEMGVESIGMSVESNEISVESSKMWSP